MLKLTLKRKIQAVIVVLAITFIAYANSTGPEARYTGAPGDIGSCVNCHDTFTNPNVGPGSVALSGLPNGNTYTPGQQYTLTLTVTQGGRQRYGFELTAIDASGNRAGTLASLSSDTQVHAQTGVGGRQYIQQSFQGTSPSTGNSRIWQFRWTAPDTDVGPVAFYFAGNAANGDGTNQGDYIYTSSSFVDSPTSKVTLSLGDPPLAGQTFTAGSIQRVNWNLTGQSNISFIEVRYSTDDGVTFPIGNLVFTTQNADASGFDWTIPNVTSSTVKLRVQISPKVGTAVTVVSGQFALQGDGTVPDTNPKIDRVELTGKKLLVFGSRFQEGAKVYMNGEKQKTVNGEPLSEMLSCKKAGKFIIPGSTVSLVVKNPDGTQSTEFLYTRPE